MEKLGPRAGFDVVSRYTSPDGGNIMAVFREAAMPEHISLVIPGNFERVSSILRGHTAIRHVFPRHPFICPLRMLASGLEERQHTRRHRPPRDILDKVIGQFLSLKA